METYIGQLQLFAFGFIPGNDGCGWLLCNGQTLSISDYQVLYSLIGIKFGGNGSTNFALPNLNSGAAFFTSPFSQWYIAATGIDFPQQS